MPAFTCAAPPPRVCVCVPNPTMSDLACVAWGTAAESFAANSPAPEESDCAPPATEAAPPASVLAPAAAEFAPPESVAAPLAAVLAPELSVPAPVSRRAAPSAAEVAPARSRVAPASALVVPASSRSVPAASSAAPACNCADPSARLAAPSFACSVPLASCPAPPATVEWVMKNSAVIAISRRLSTTTVMRMPRPWVWVAGSVLVIEYSLVRPCAKPPLVSHTRGRRCGIDCSGRGVPEKQP